MIDKRKMMFLQKQLMTCENILGAESQVINNGDGESFGVEFEGYQTLKFKIKPIFDMPDEEVIALVNLFAYGMPILAELLQENARLESTVEALIDSIATVSLVVSHKTRRAGRDIQEEEVDKDNNGGQTVGER